MMLIKEIAVYVNILNSRIKKYFIDKLQEVSTFRGKKVRVVSVPPHSLNVETEGETLTNSPFDFEIIPLAINMVVPEDHKF